MCDTARFTSILEIAS